jgi:hypothetical protein
MRPAPTVNQNVRKGGRNETFSQLLHAYGVFNLNIMPYDNSLPLTLSLLLLFVVYKSIRYILLVISSITIIVSLIDCRTAFPGFRF